MIDIRIGKNISSNVVDDFNEFYVIHLIKLLINIILFQVS